MKDSMKVSIKQSKIQIVMMVIAAILLSTAINLSANDSGKNAPLELNWDMLSKVKIVLKDSRYQPEFDNSIVGLDGKIVKLRGYIVPLEQGKEHTYFMISANPISSCFFCGGAGPETMAEVRTARAVPFGYEPIDIIGTLRILEDDPMGLFYSIKDARLGS